MGKAPNNRKAGASSSSQKPYDRSSKGSGAAKNNVFKFNTNVGQHILKNPGIADAIVDKAFLKPTDTVLEIGPGTGNISVRILEKAKKLIAIELDPRMASEIVKRTMGGPHQKKLEVLLGDAIKLDFPAHDVCISNTPYQISSPLVMKLLSMPNPPRCAVLMFQREFALRLTARPGDPLYNRLSVNVQFFSKVTHIMKVGKANFRPPPQVESSVVRIEPFVGKERPTVSWAEFDGLLRVVFSRKNKTIRASFSPKEIMSLLERNYCTYCALHNIPVDKSIVENGGAEANADEDLDMDVDADNVGPTGTGEANEWGGIMDVDDNDAGEDDDDDDIPAFFKETATTAIGKTPSRRKKTKVAELVRAKVARVLESTELGDQRAGKLDENAFLKLLYAFNQENIHFA